MALSKEIQEYHLTPNGWIKGSFIGDAIGGTNDIAIPEDRVLTIACFEELPSAFSKPDYYDQIIWKSDNELLIEKLKIKWGEKPDWYGYKIMKE